MPKVSEQTAELERELDALGRKCQQIDDRRHELARLLVVAESHEKQARVEGAREGFVKGALWLRDVMAFGIVANAMHVTPERIDIAAVREYPVTGEEPTQTSRHAPIMEWEVNPNVSPPRVAEEPTRGERCVCGHVAASHLCGECRGTDCQCSEFRPAPPAVTEPPEDEAWGWVVLNKNGNVATTHGGYPALITVTEARKRGMPRNGGDWIDALCVLLNANTGDEFAPFTVVRLHAWGILASRPTASGEG